jgi:hypothetical protein
VELEISGHLSVLSQGLEPPGRVTSEALRHGNDPRAPAPDSHRVGSQFGPHTSGTKTTEKLTNSAMLRRTG